MPGLLAGVFGLALFDSLNPSAILVTLTLLTGAAYTSKVANYLAGVVSAYFVIGLLLLLGLDLATTVAGSFFNGPVAYGVQGVTGALLLLYALFPPGKGKARESPIPASTRPGALFLLGVTVTVVEITTALPYFGAIGLLTSANLPLAQSLPILAVYNLIFVAPPLLLLALYSIFGARLEARFAGCRAKLAAGSREATLWIVGIVGFYLLTGSLASFDFFGVIEFLDAIKTGADR